MSERALRVLRKEAEKYSEVRSRLATAEGLHAAALFQEGLKQATLPGQSPVKGEIPAGYIHVHILIHVMYIHAWPGSVPDL